MSDSDRLKDLRPTAASTINNAPTGLTRLFVNSEDSNELYAINDTGSAFKAVSGGGATGLPAGYVNGAALTFVSTTTVSAGTTGEDTSVRDVDDSFDLTFTGTLNAVITSTGAGGRQTGTSETSNTWYGVHIIGDTTLVNSTNVLLIPDGTGFSETGYDVNRRVGWVRNNASSNLLAFYTEGKGDRMFVYYDEDGNDLYVLNAGISAIFVDVDCSSFIPPSGNFSFIQYGITPFNTSGRIFLRPNGSTADGIGNSVKPGATLATSQRNVGWLFTDDSQIVEYRLNSSSDTGYIRILGYYDNR